MVQLSSQGGHRVYQCGNRYKFKRRQHSSQQRRPNRVIETREADASRLPRLECMDQEFEYKCVFSC